MQRIILVQLYSIISSAYENEYGMYKVYIRAVAKNLIFIYKLSRGVPRSPLQVALPSGAHLQSLGIYSLSAVPNYGAERSPHLPFVRFSRERFTCIVLVADSDCGAISSSTGWCWHCEAFETCPALQRLNHNAIHCYSQRPSTIGCTSSAS